MDAEFEQGPGCSDLRLKGEILGALSDWQAEYGPVDLDLAWTVVQMLFQHLRRASLADYIKFEERLAVILIEEAAQLRQVIAEDSHRRAH